MDKYNLPTATILAGNVCEFNTDYREILKIFEILNDPDLLERERIIVSLKFFYKTEDYIKDINQAIKEMFDFIAGGTLEDDKDEPTKKPLYDWDKDFSIIVAPINKTIGSDVRGLKYLHWWTFLSAFMEIGECTFSTFVAIRDKLNRGVKLDKSEERIYKENRDRIVLKKKYDSTTQAIMDEIMGRG